MIIRHINSLKQYFYKNIIMFNSTEEVAFSGGVSSAITHLSDIHKKMYWEKIGVGREHSFLSVA